MNLDLRPNWVGCWGVRYHLEKNIWKKKKKKVIIWKMIIWKKFIWKMIIWKKLGPIFGVIIWKKVHLEKDHLEKNHLEKRKNYHFGWFLAQGQGPNPPCANVMRPRAWAWAKHRA